jgi:DNA-binding response OmpR family regulator
MGVSINPVPAVAASAHMEKILIVEDDRAVQRALKRVFQSEDYDVRVASDGASALGTFRSFVPDLVVLDLRLPGMPGRDICRAMKKESSGVSIIILSAKTDVAEKVLLLELGADDYVTKPFSPRELVARVRAVSRRSAIPATTADRYSFGEVSVDFERMQITRAGQPVSLTAQEFKVLKFFLQNPERVLARAELLNEVWGYHSYPSTRTVDNHLWKLRQKLEADPENPAHFLTVHAAGYRFVP